ncbi:hypothetical protein FBU30_004978 [Linnemannia zychae]|nr:hypothetical protein FBU30_004978 [Linnemannia zychae]
MDNPYHPSPSAVLARLRSLSIFFLPKDLADALTFTTPEVLLQSSTQHLISSTTHEPADSKNNDVPDKVLSIPLQIVPSCRTCGVKSFTSVNSQREHVKSSWHLYNLKQQLLESNAAPVSFLQFQEMLHHAATTSSKEATSSADTHTDLGHSFQTSNADSSMVLYNNSQVAVQTLIKQLETNVKEAKVARSSDPRLLRQKMIQQQQLQEFSRSPFLWFSSDLYGPSVQFGIYKNALTNKGQCDHLVEHIQSIQIPVPPPPPKKARIRRAARAKALQQKQKLERPEETEQDPALILQEGLEREVEELKEPKASDPIDNAVCEEPSTLAQFPETSPRYWTLILIGGGHFAGMVIDVRGVARKPHSQGSHARELKIVVHKTFHRYTVRRKNGGAQSSFGAAKSAGAMVRMYNERALKLEVRELLESWSDWIMQSECVFMHAPGNNKRTVFYEDSVMNRADREGILRSFPFVTRRPTLIELKRAYQELTTVKVKHSSQDDALIDTTGQDAAIMAIELKRKSNTPVVPPVKTVPISTPAVAGSLLKLAELVKKGRVDAIDNYLARTGFNPSQLLPTSPRHEYDQRRTPTLLHLASLHGQARVVQQLLEKHGADPTATIPSLVMHMDRNLEPVSEELLDLAIHAKPWTAYDLAKDKETRNAFRRAMAKMPDAWDWVGLARVPSALTPEMETESKRHTKSKHKSKGKSNRNEKTQEPDTVLLNESSVETEFHPSKTPCPTVEERMAADREKRAMAAEIRRAAQISARAKQLVKPKGKDECTSCGSDLGALSPFERFGHQCDKQSSFKGRS